MTSIIPKITNISSRVIRVLGCNPGYFTLQGTNTYLLGTGKERMLIDCGEQDVPEYVDILKKVIKDNGISLKKILITHWHPDHIGGTKDVLKYVADKDCKVYKYPEKDHDNIYKENFEINYLKDEEEVGVEGATVEAHLTPGHAKDHLSFRLKEENTIFSADCILGEGSVVFEDLSTYLNSLNKLLTMQPGKLYPGHGPVIDNPPEKIREYINRRIQRENQILDILNKKQGEAMTTLEIVKEMYQGLSKELMFGADYNVKHHIEKLLKEERVEEIEQHFEDILVPKYRIKL